MAQRSLQENCEPCSPSTDVETARRFFSGISDDAADTEHLIAIRTLLDRATRWFTDPDAAATYAVARANTSDVYVGVGLYRAGITGGRGTAADVRRIVGLWGGLTFCKTDPGRHR